MRGQTPTVWEDIGTGQYWLESRLRLDTPAWLAWLDDPATTSFSFPLLDRAQGYIAGFVTVRKERRQRGGAYWTVYGRVGRQVRKVCLGPASAVTTHQLRVLADAWLIARATADTQGNQDDGGSRLDWPTFKPASWLLDKPAPTAGTRARRGRKPRYSMLVETRMAMLQHQPTPELPDDSDE